MGIVIGPDVPDIITEYTIEGRKANNILADAYGLSLYKQQVNHEGGKEVIVTEEDVFEVVRNSRLVPYVLQKASETEEVGKVFGLGVAGFIGSVLEIEALVFSSAQEGKGQVRFNDTAGSMAKDSVFNASSVFRKVTGQDLGNYNVHVNVIGGGNIDGPSAGVAIFTSIYSAVYHKPIKQNIAVTGELSIQGKVKPVGGIIEKIYGAKQAGIAKVIIPQENKNDIPAGLKGIKVVTVSTIEEALEQLFGKELCAKA